MLNNQTVGIFESKGFTVKHTMKSVNGSRGVFNALFSVCYNDTEILYLRRNADNTFNTIELLNYPSSFHKLMTNLNLERVMEVLQSVIKNNFK